MEDAGIDIDIDEYNVLDEDRCFDPVEDCLEAIRDIGIPAAESKCVGCVAVKDEREIMRLLSVLQDKIELIEPDVSLVDPTVTVIEIVEIVMYLGLDVVKTNAVVDPELNSPFDRAVYDAEFGLVRVTELIVVICEANDLEWGNIEGKLGR